MNGLEGLGLMIIGFDMSGAKCFESLEERGRVSWKERELESEMYIEEELHRCTASGKVESGGCLA
jgi:hypothetical protein